MIDILLKYILWYEFLNDLGAQRNIMIKLSTLQLITVVISIL